MTLFLLPLGIGIACGLLRGGKVRNVTSLPLRHGWVIPLAMGAQLLLIFAKPALPENGADPLRFWLPLTFLPLTWFVLSNVRLWGMQLILVGLLANGAVILLNGGLMPTNADALRRAGLTSAIQTAREHPGIRLPSSKDVLVPVDQTPLWWLSDTLVSPPLPSRKVMSVGDLFVLSGLALLVAQATLYPAGDLPRPRGDRPSRRPTIAAIPQQ